MASAPADVGANTNAEASPGANHMQSPGNINRSSEKQRERKARPSAQIYVPKGRRKTLETHQIADSQVNRHLPASHQQKPCISDASITQSQSPCEAIIVNEIMGDNSSPSTTSRDVLQQCGDIVLQEPLLIIRDTSSVNNLSQLVLVGDRDHTNSELKQTVTSDDTSYPVNNVLSDVGDSVLSLEECNFKKLRDKTNLKNSDRSSGVCGITCTTCEKDTSILVPEVQNKELLSCEEAVHHSNCPISEFTSGERVSHSGMYEQILETTTEEHLKITHDNTPGLTTHGQVLQVSNQEEPLDDAQHESASGLTSYMLPTEIHSCWAPKAGVLQLSLDTSCLTKPNCELIDCSSNGTVERLESSVVSLSEEPAAAIFNPQDKAVGDYVPVNLSPPKSLPIQDDKDSWDTLFDDDGECLDATILKEITDAVGKVKIKKPIIDYLEFTPKDVDIDDEEYAHLIEIYGFDASLKTPDLINIFRPLVSKEFDVKWVDDTHAIGVFANRTAAQDALLYSHPLVQTRPMSQASRPTKLKAKTCTEFLLPVKERPQTSVSAARRLVSGALGISPKISSEQRVKERQQLKEAKDRKKNEIRSKQDAWEGSFDEDNVQLHQSSDSSSPAPNRKAKLIAGYGKCAMDSL